ncbi:beta-mannosidase [Flavobacterium jejuense]|uniref:Mannan endo-1,4-beta-mannosidase n=1 Tax=Flavobacterium jejuense TaxID=1544455 RepID=A0ABX0J1I1_9FLAO|nr:glycosyl hydrolase [Flavobacterium jejuense]NHN27780.1 beta-mannosidase [Flavobacterium jejuense]
MTKFKTYYFLLLIPLLISCSILKKSNSYITDKKATRKTRILYDNLFKSLDKGILFGHQDDLAYGVEWKYEKDRSDIKDVTGDYPAVYGWDIGGLEKDSPNNIDGVPFDKMKKWITEVYNRGGVNTISWHMDNPYTGKNSWDTTPNSLISILPNGEKHQLYISWLDKAADFFNSLKGKRGRKIPILYRPFHELTGNWFWWCKNNATPEEFKQLWEFTINYWRNTKKVHNLIIVYNTSSFMTKEDFMEYYPGNNLVDMLSFDNYIYKNPTEDSTFIKNCQRQFQIMDEIAKDNHKIPAFAETGYEGIPYEKFWTETLLDAIGSYKISYVLVWRNHGWQEKEKKMHYYAPYKGQVNEKDFVDFYNLDKILFQKEVSKINLYKK